MKYFRNIHIASVFRNRHEPESMHALADAYWHSVIILSALLLVGVLAMDFLQYSMITGGSAPSSPQTATKDEKNAFDKDQLKAIVDNFAQRRINAGLYSSAGTQIPDPTK